MALKRKRASATISSPASITSDATTQSASPPPFSFPQHSQPAELSQKPTWSFPTYEDHQQQHLNSRTQKRYRNNRPDEQSVYANTITMLYDAQKQLNIASAVRSEPTTTPPPEPVQLPTQRTTLHSFWRIPRPPPGTSMARDDCASDSVVNREMSSASIRQDDAMDVDDSIVDHDTTCQS